MTFRFECPSCHTEQSAADVLIGRRVRCPNCEQLVRAVPTDGSSETPGDSPPTAESEATPAVDDQPAPEPTTQPETEPANEAAQPTEPAAPEEPADNWTPEPLAPPPPPPVADRQPASIPAAVGGSRWAMPPASPEDDVETIRFGDDDRYDETQMDMTPMVDVTFLLLIFFMVTAAFSLQKSIEVPNPNPEEASTQSAPQDIEENPEYVTVTVDAFNTFRVITVDWDEEAPSEQDLLVKLRAARDGDSQGRIPTKLLVQANGEAIHEKVVTALDAGTAVGMEQVQLMTVEDE